MPSQKLLLWWRLPELFRKLLFHLGWNRESDLHGKELCGWIDTDRGRENRLRKLVTFATLLLGFIDIVLEVDRGGVFRRNLYFILAHAKSGYRRTTDDHRNRPWHGVGDFQLLHRSLVPSQVYFLLVQFDLSKNRLGHRSRILQHGLNFGIDGRSIRPWIVRCYR